MDANSAYTNGGFLASNWAQAALFGAGDLPGVSVRSALGILARNAAVRNIEELLRPAGRLIGVAGSDKTIRVLHGGAPAAEAFFYQLTSEAKLVANASYEGILGEIDGGGFVGYRTLSKSGPPTLDINIPGLPDISKIKFLP